jgi:hypothetical protein
VCGEEEVRNQGKFAARYTLNGKAIRPARSEFSQGATRICVGGTTRSLKGRIARMISVVIHHALPYSTALQHCL